MVSRRTGALGVAAGAVAAGTVIATRTLARGRQTDLSSLEDQPLDRAGRIVTDDGVGLHYEEVGPADARVTVVFAHGFCLRMGEFCFQRRELAERFGDEIRMVFYDQRSHGRSDRSDPEHASIDQLGRDLATLLDALVPRGPVVLVGHSMGGMTIMALADSRPELFTAGRIAGVMLLSTSAGRMGTVTLGLPSKLARLNSPVLPLLLRGARSQTALVEAGRAVGSDVAWVITRRMSFGNTRVDPVTVEYLTTMLASTRVDVVADFFQTFIDHDKLAAVGTLRNTPTVIMCGDRDLLTPLSHSEELAASLPSAQLIVVPRAGHMALMESPGQVADAIAVLIDGALATRRPGLLGRWLRG